MGARSSSNRERVGERTRAQCRHACRIDRSRTLVCITRAPAKEANPSRVLQYFFISNAFWLDFPAPANKKRSNRAQNDYEMMDSTMSAKNDTLPSSLVNKDAIINIPDEQNVTKRLPVTKALPQEQPEKQHNLPPFEHG